MLNINLKARLENKTFWISLIGAIILLIQQLGFNATQFIPSNYVDIINSIFGILTILGIIIDPTTSGISDQVTTSNSTENQIQVVNDNINTNVADSSNSTDSTDATDSTEDDVKNAIIVNSTITPKANTADDTPNA